MGFEWVRGEGDPGGPAHSPNEGRGIWNRIIRELFRTRLPASDLVSDYVVSGLLASVPAPPTTLSLSVPAGAAWIGGERVESAAQAVALVASRDAYVDLKADGTLGKTEVANGAAPPPVAAGSTRLFRATTDAPIAQVVSVDVTASPASTTFAASINGTVVSYVSDATPTEGEVARGLVAAINASIDPSVTPVTASTSALATDAQASFTVAADVPGTAFTLSVGANLAASTTTPNKAAQVTAIADLRDLDPNVRGAVGQAALDSKADLVAGKVPLSQMHDAVLGGLDPKGTWNASTNTPNLLTNPPAANDPGYYKVTVAGTTALGPAPLNEWAIGDWAVWIGGSWDKVDNSEAGAAVPDATETTPGKAEIATQAEVDAGTDDSRIVTALKLASRLGRLPVVTADLANPGEGQGWIRDDLSPKQVRYRVAGLTYYHDLKAVPVLDSRFIEVATGTASGGGGAYYGRRFAPLVSGFHVRGVRLHGSGSGVTYTGRLFDAASSVLASVVGVGNGGDLDLLFASPVAIPVGALAEIGVGSSVVDNPPSRLGPTADNADVDWRSAASSTGNGSVIAQSADGLTGRQFEVGYHPSAALLYGVMA